MLSMLKPSGPEGAYVLGTSSGVSATAAGRGLPSLTTVTTVGVISVTERLAVVAGDSPDDSV